MIRPLILFLLMVANAACVSYVDDFAYLPVLRAQQGGGEFDVRVGANVAQTIRKNFEWNPIFESVAQRSVALAARRVGAASQCMKHMQIPTSHARSHATISHAKTFSSSRSACRSSVFTP